MTNLLKISKQTVDRLLRKAKAGTYWAAELRGFGVRVSATSGGNRVRYVCKWQVGGVQHWRTLGEHGRGTGLPLGQPQTWTPGHARNEARALLGTRPVSEENRRAELSVAALVKEYVDDRAAAGRAPHTLREYRRQEAQLVAPSKLGRMRARDVREVDVDDFKRGLRKTPSQANRVLALLQAAFGWGRLRPNPAADVERYKAGQRRRKRHLADHELAAVGRALRDLEAEDELQPVAAGFLRALLLSGARPGELSALKWSQVDYEAGRIRLGRTKTGEADPRAASGLVITPPLQEVLAAVAAYREEGGEYVFPGRWPRTHLTDYGAPWRLVIKRAGLDTNDKDLVPYIARHTVGTTGGATLPSLKLVAGILGHAQLRTTEQYAHDTHEPVVQAARQVAQVIAEKLEGTKP